MEHLFLPANDSSTLALWSVVSFLWSPFCGALSVVPCLWSPVCGPLSVVPCLWSPVCGLPSVVSHLWCPVSGLLSVVSSLWSPVCGLRPSALVGLLRAVWKERGAKQWIMSSSGGLEQAGCEGKHNLQTDRGGDSQHGVSGFLRVSPSWVEVSSQSSGGNQLYCGP